MSVPLVEPAAHKALMVPGVVDSICANISVRDRVALGYTCRALLPALGLAWADANTAHIRCLSAAANPYATAQAIRRTHVYRASIRRLELDTDAVDPDEFETLGDRRVAAFPNLRKLEAVVPESTGIQLVCFCLTPTVLSVDVTIGKSATSTELTWTNTLSSLLTQLPARCKYLEHLAIHRKDSPKLPLAIPTSPFRGDLTGLKKVSMHFSFLSPTVLKHLADTNVTSLEVLGATDALSSQFSAATSDGMPLWECLKDVVLEGSVGHLIGLLRAFNAAIRGLELRVPRPNPMLSTLSDLAFTIARSCCWLKKVEFKVKGEKGPTATELDLDEFVPLKNCHYIEHFSITYDARKPLTTRDNSLTRLTANWRELKYFKAVWSGRRSFVGDDSSLAGFPVTDIAEMTHTCPNLDTVVLTLATFEEDLDWPEPLHSNHKLTLHLDDLIGDEVYFGDATDRIWPGLTLVFNGQEPYVVGVAKRYLRKIHEALARIEQRHRARLSAATM